MERFKPNRAINASMGRNSMVVILAEACANNQTTKENDRNRKRPNTAPSRRWR
jgi:hypothetical protein